ncbi:MAG: 50S ribosomal protein L31 [Candidatus Levybacteria bacterium RIFCSPHIGHO2_12_FULL_38_12]|nr:MAG: 50S ribosomal protein L31 [Candidatus Levybacteria bacterium RIFCSPHIGHO2_01_FULL_38_12]OGH22109.1 MAG: 50S ribosomal protein L31 [Candidatus Levybacteria bacterium RIFCSPHIGHO2_02_FULL_37_18]OGH22957.1 MAG: 50S ribosomal protein L31 [Candidatus Levybacteria bacterium RIFCSPHIGHO2_12_FULL_38_12]OGH34127.1 MAG: 50S ribosomal protein L31 [Candidatus Levybacteria bacterium RIFCSPLOWO2_01_FULL_37_20]OGH44920.1 MAG: 50S ribosomal protein L31 [Candidatus Levybacteria bacterium RIFCSPLOWO2_02_
MKANIHPQYFDNATVICSCGNKFTTGSTVELIHIELCSKCHPFYTGEQRFVDSASRIQKFQQKQQTATQKPYVSKKAKLAKKQQKSNSAPKTLREMLLEVSK